MSKHKSNATLDFDTMWAMLSRSTATRNQIEKICNDMVEEIKRIAVAEAFDKGKYASSIKASVVGAQQARRALKNASSSRTRRLQGVEGKNKFIDVEFKGDSDGGAYDGSVGIVASANYLSPIIEFGSLARKASFIFTTVAQNFSKDGIEFVKIFEGKEHKQDLDALSQSIKRGKANARRKREKAAKEKAAKEKAGGN